MTSPFDWKNQKHGWKYKGINDPMYQKDRAKLFEKNGNGWWIFQNLRNRPIRGKETGIEIVSISSDYY